MAEKKGFVRNSIPIIAVAWILSLITTLTVVYLVPSASINTNQIADSAITYLKLAPFAIPHNSTQSTTVVSTTSTSWVDMPDMAVNITVTRKSTLVIMFSTEAWSKGGNYIYARAMIDATTQAHPISSAILITNSTDGASHSIMFYRENVSPGIYKIKIQWRMLSSLVAGYAHERALVVFALPV